MEKRKPHYDLNSIKAMFSAPASLRITRSALGTAEALGLTLQGIVDLIQRMTREQFYKSMTSIANSAVWQDVYHVPYRGALLYVKFTTDSDGYLVISLKER